MSWSTISLEDGNRYAIVPNEDTIYHEDDDCICGPVVEPVKRDDGSVGWIETHHSLDGRELDE